MINKENYVQVLNEILLKKRNANPLYSTRALARDLNMDSTDLFKILKGKRNVSPRVAYKIGNHMNLQGQELLEFILPTFE